MARGEDESRLQGLPPRRNPFRQEILDIEEATRERQEESSQESGEPISEGQSTPSSATEALAAGQIRDGNGKVLVSHPTLRGRELLEEIIDKQPELLRGADLSGAPLSRLHISGTVVLEDINFSGADLSGLFAEGLTLKGGSIENANLERAKLTDCTLHEVNLDGANFREGDLFRVTFSGTKDSRDLFFADAILDEVRFVQTWLNNSSFLRAQLLRSTFDVSHIFGCDFTQTKGSQRSSFSEVEFRDCNFSDADFDSCLFRKTTFSHLGGSDANDLSGARFVGCQMKEVDLRGISVGLKAMPSTPGFAPSYLPAVFVDSNLDGAKMNGMDLTHLDLRQVSLRNANLQGANLAGLHLSDTEMSGAWLAGADMSGGTFRGNNFSDATFTKANLSGADLQGANLENADLWGAFLNKTKLRKANLKGTGFSGILGKLRLRLKRNNP